MTNKTKVIVTYDDDSKEELNISSTRVLTEDLTKLKTSGVNGYVNLIQIAKSIDAFLRSHNIKKLTFKEEEE